MMEIFVFARLHARPGCADALAAAVRAVLVPTRAEPGCLAARSFHGRRDPLLFYIHSRWRDEAALDAHLGLAHTQRFVAETAPLLDHRLEATRTALIG